MNVFDFANDQPFSQGNIGFDPRTGELLEADEFFIQRTIGAFFQDDWKVRPNLTLSFGVRWESFGNPGERFDKIKNVRFRSGQDFFSRVSDLKVEVTGKLLQKSDLNNFAPRFGFAWDPTSRGKMSIRGGVGVFYDRFGNQMWAAQRTNPPTFALATASIFTPPVLPVYALGTSGEEPYGFPRPGTLRLGLDDRNGPLQGRVVITGTDPRLRTQYGYNWSLSTQYAFTREWIAEGAYIGSVGRKLYGVYDVNRFAGDLVEDGRLDRLNPSFGSSNYGHNTFNSGYHGGTFSVRNHFPGGVNFQAAYTLGKAIDQASSFGPGLSVVDATNLRRERGLADFDVRQRLSFSLLYRVPEPSFGSTFLNRLLGGWQVGNLTILQSGTPFSVFCTQSFIPVRDAQGRIVGNRGCDYNGDGLNYDVPHEASFGNSLRGLRRSAYIAGIFTASDFPVPGLGQQGTLGRNTFIGPGYANTDFSLIKNARMPWVLGGDGANLQFRVEFFNLFNRVNLSRMTGNLASPQFGRATSTFPARNIQFAFRISF